MTPTATIPAAAKILGPAGSGNIRREFERPPRELVERLAWLPIANISDALNKHGVCHHEIRPIASGARACGPALTCGSLDLTVKIYALRLAQPGDVFVLAAGGVHDYACFGELSATILAQRGAAGAVIDGAIRDPIGIRQAGLPVFARAVTPRNYHYPFGLPYGSVNHPVVCGGITVAPGDIVIADDDGTIVVPRQIAAEVADAAEQIEADENQRRASILAGTPVPAAIEDSLRNAGYTIQ